MNGRGKSDSRVVPAKLANKTGQPVAELVEERRLAKGNTGQQNALRTQGRDVDASSALERVRRVARKDKEARFTALLHHVDLDRLWAAYAAISPTAAPGVDQVTWAAYGQDLRANLEDLLRRVHSGAYRASPSRRVYIPKPDGRQRPLGIATLEDKIVQRAVVEVLNAIYEEDFLGFSYGFLPLADSIGVITEDAAAAAAARFGGPVALRADVPGLLRTSAADNVLTGLHGADEVRRGFRSLQQTFGRRLAGVIVQPVITGGVEVRISVLHEQVAGPLVLFGLGSADGDVLADRAARLAPLTDADADDLIRSAPAAPRLLGRRGAPAADLAALRDMLLRVSRMADDLPQVAELELSPVIARPDGVQAVDGRIRIQAAEPADAHLRRLP